MGFSGFAQTCRDSLYGHVIAMETKVSLGEVTVRIRETGSTTMADHYGRFTLALCPGNYHLQISRVGYDSLDQLIVFDTTRNMIFSMRRQTGQLQEVEVVSEHKQDIATNASTSVSARQLLQVSGQTLGESLKNVPGLNSIQTGPSISKPVIHGLHSNRLLILNNGVRQEGQQWGSEHAPEIDPFIANRITVIKGASSVRYGSDAIVGVILVEPKALNPQKKLEGEINAVAGSNGRLGAFSAMLQGKGSGKFQGFNWRAQGTLKRAGNFRTSSYYLKNTGLREEDYSLAANYKSRSENFGAEIYYSHFDNKVGIFEGSHVGNVSDLQAAFARSKPITASFFSYDIARTYQQINHDLLKATAFYRFKNSGRLEVQFASQKNKRDEYDIDIPYSSDPGVLSRPQISFKIRTQTLDLLYHQKAGNHFSGLFGITGETQGNVFNGIRYLVPNFRNYQGGAFAIEKFTKNKWLLEAGLRYDYRWLRVYRLDNNTLTAYHNTSDYENTTGTVGASYRINEKLSLSANIGTAWRAPSVNELYIDGIHLSAASYEKGDSSLHSERSYNFTVSGKYEVDRFSAEVVLYDNIINGFIYAKPSLTPITLISGTFPLFNYTQADVNLKGFDLELKYTFLKHLSIDSKTAIVRGWNKSADDYLIFMPADRLDNSIRYELEQVHALSHVFVSVGNVTVFRQTRVPPRSDYVDPPAGYSIYNANLGCEWPMGNKTLSLDLGAYNLTNVAYRDYLNRFRYYADDLGRNIALRAKLSF